jgi:AMP deaminase
MMEPKNAVFSGQSIVWQNKRRWLGSDYKLDGPAGNDLQRTSVSNIRVSFRFETFVEELSMIMHALTFSIADVD